MNTDERLAVIETKLDNITDVLHEHAKAAISQNRRSVLVADKQDVRLRSLERFRNIAIGVGLAVSGGGGTLVYKYLTPLL